MLCFDDNSSNNVQDLSPNKESNYSSNEFSANEPSTSKKMAHHVVDRVHIAPEKVFEQGHVINKKISTQKTQN